MPGDGAWELLKEFCLEKKKFVTWLTFRLQLIKTLVGYLIAYFTTNQLLIAVVFILNNY